MTEIKQKRTRRTKAQMADARQSPIEIGYIRHDPIARVDKPVSGRDMILNQVVPIPLKSRARSIEYLMQDIK